MAVVGAGACVLPSWLASLSPCCRVTAVEQLAEVVVAARRCFGVDDVRPLEQLEVLVEEGTSFITRCAEHSYDAVLVTAGGDGGGEQLAPPASMTAPGFCAAVHQALKPGGVYAANILCQTEAGERKAVRDLAHQLTEAGFDGIHVATTGAPPHSNRLLFACALGTDGSAADEVDAGGLVSRLVELGFENRMGLLQRQDQLMTLPVNVAWQTWDQWDATNTSPN